MRPTEVRLIEEVDAEPGDDERLLVYADWLQMRGDPRGELIALDVHARVHGTRDPRTRELEIEVEAALLARLDVVGGVEFGWHGGFLRDVIVPGKLVPVITERSWLADPAFSRLRSLAIDSTTTTSGNDDPSALLASAPGLASLERLAIGGSRLPSPTPTLLAQLVARLPKLHDLELVGCTTLDAEHLTALAPAKLDALAMWMPCDDTALERLLQMPSELTRLTVLQEHRDPTHRAAPDGVRRLLSGHYQPRIERLALMGGGYERELLQLTTGRSIATRLLALGLDWNRVDNDTLLYAAGWLGKLQLIWPRPLGTTPDPDHDFQLARRLKAIGRLDDALLHARRACDRGGTSYLHWLELATIHDARHGIRDYLDATTRALQLDRDGLEAWTHRGRALLALGHYDEARLAFERVIELAPNEGHHHLQLGRLHALRGNVESALIALEHAAERTPRRADEAILIAVELLCELDDPARVELLVERHPTLHRQTRVRASATRMLASGQVDRVLGIVLPHADLDVAGAHLCAAALRGQGDHERARQVMRRFVASLACPALIASGWVGLALSGEDGFAVATFDPALLADQIADHLNPTRISPIHHTHDRPTDRLLAAAYAIATAAVLRPDEVPPRIAVFADWLDAAPRKTAGTGYCDHVLFTAAAAAAPAWSARLDTLYQVIAGRLPRHVLRQLD